MERRPALRVMLLTRDDHWCRSAATMARTSLDATVMTGEWGEDLPEILGHERGDVLLSFLAPWVIPPGVLDSFRLAINFHPGDRHYPGIGCTNFAIYEGAESFGAVAHHMVAAVDSGPIFMEHTFRLVAADTVQSVRERTMAVMLAMFSNVIDMLPGIPPGEPIWSRRPFTRRELDQLCELRPDMSEAEMARRIRATAYPGKPGARLRIGGLSFSPN